MRCTGLAILALVGAVTAEAVGQYPYGNYYHASTVGESYARGMSDVIRARGEAELNNSAAAQNYAEARKSEIENRYQATKAYFEIREMNRMYRAKERGPRPTTEQLIRYARAGRPDELTNDQLDPYTGAITWPVALNAVQYEEQRKLLEHLFAERALNQGTLSLGQISEAGQATDAMLAMLKEQISDLPTNVYLEAKGFLQSLSYVANT